MASWAGEAGRGRGGGGWGVEVGGSEVGCGGTVAAQMSGTLIREKTVAEVGGRWGGRGGWGRGEYLLKTAN